MRRRRASKLAVVVGGAVMVLAVGAGPVLADPGYGERPGYGTGDSAHDHEDGPPGLDLEGENERPGSTTAPDPNHNRDDGPPGQNGS